MPEGMDEAGYDGSPEQPAGGLRQLLEALAMRDPTDEELDRLKIELSDPLLDLGGAEIEDLVQGWTKALRRSLTLDIPGVNILCGFSSVLDTVYQLDPQGSEAEMLIQWVASQLKITVDDLIDLALKVAKKEASRIGDSGAKPEHWTIDDLTQGDGRAFDLIDVVALLFWCMENRGRKPLLQSPELQKQIEAYIAWRRIQQPQPNMAPFLGGAAGNMCYILCELGLQVSGHWLYHPEPLAQASSSSLTRVVLTKSNAQQVKQEEPARRKGIYFDSDHQVQEHPVRRNTSFEFPQSMPVRTTNGTIVKQANNPDRAIFRTLLHRSPDRGWDTIVLRVPALGGGTTDLILNRAQQDRLLGNNGWPFVPLFCSWYVDMNQLVIEVADDAGMKQIAEQFEYFILTALQGVGDPITNLPVQPGAAGRGPNLGNVVKDHLIRQLRVLSENGVVIHTEVPAPSPQLFDEMSTVISRGRIQSVGINDDDLFKVTGSDDFRGTRFFHSDLNPDERNPARKHLATFRRYQRATYLARQLDVDELYVHGNDVDIVVRRRTSRGAIWREIEALLLTKAAVVLALLRRSGMVGSYSLSPVLTANGFRGVAEFAKGFAQNRYPSDDAKSRRLFNEILDYKYFFERDPEAYSVTVVPVLWPDPSPQIVTVGAGDMTSSVVAIFAGK